MFNEPVSVDDNFTMAHVIIMFYVDALIYLLLALYIENIWPGQYGIPKFVIVAPVDFRSFRARSRGFLYPFKLSYWRGYQKSNVAYVPAVTNGDSNVESRNPTAFEAEPIDKELGVQLINVSKVTDEHTASLIPAFSFRFLDVLVSSQKSSICSSCHRSQYEYL